MISLHIRNTVLMCIYANLKMLRSFISVHISFAIYLFIYINNRVFDMLYVVNVCLSLSVCLAGWLYVCMYVCLSAFSINLYSCPHVVR